MSFFGELKRRNVIRVAVVYLVLSWLLLQVAAVLVDTLELSTLWSKTVVAILIIGFIPALVFSWVYELTPEGLKKESDVRPEDSVTAQTAKKLDIAAIVLLAAAMGLFAIDRFLLDHGREAAPTEERVGAEAPEAVRQPEAALAHGLAVLPFANMSPDQENAFFASGVHGEILNKLAKIGNLKVISRSSVMTYGENPPNLRKIAEELGVSHIVKGSVRRFGNRVRVSAQLIDAHTSVHLWADNFARELTMENIIVIQSEIAREIAAALETEFSPEEAVRIAKKPTENLQAYDYYLKARDYHFRFRENIDEGFQAERLYERAIKLDPAFALAYANLSVLHSDFYWFLMDPSEERLQKAKIAVDQALRLQPDLTEGLIALGYYHYYGFRDYARAQEILEKVSQSEPNNAEIHGLLAYTQRRQGLWEKCLNNLKRAAELDPRNAEYWIDLAQTYNALREYPLAIEYLYKAIDLTPESILTPILKGDYYMNWKGDTSIMKGILEEIPASLDPQGFVSLFRWWVTFWERDYQKALAVLETFTGAFFDTQIEIIHKEYLKGELYQLMGEEEKSRMSLLASLEYLEPAALEHRDAPRYHSALGLAYARLGRKEAAIRQGFEAVKLLPIAKDAMDGPSYAGSLALIYTLVGEKERAIDELEELLTKPGPLSREQLRNLPYWDALRDNPRFQALLENGNGGH